jgi:hypothetical protein
MITQTEKEINQLISEGIDYSNGEKVWKGIDKLLKLKKKNEEYCGNERPKRKTLCQLKKGHEGSHQAVIFWEDEQ